MMQMADILKAFKEYRGDAIVVPGKSTRYWNDMSTHPELDVPLTPGSAMGGRAAFAFGLALAQPHRKVVLLDSEGDMVMGLNILPTIAEHAPKNFYHFVLDNECYATTGGQPVPNAKNIAYDVIARGAGYAHTYSYDNLETFQINLERIMSGPGPVFVALKIVPEIENEPIGQRKRVTTRNPEQVRKDLWKALGIAG
jgi:thiamine pyrophosphate-dependent acetolactate synthase large subunit-like protein